MLANYHTHTYLCNHAVGTMREYVEEAIKNGLEILGFSDHIPQNFTNGHRSCSSMKINETEFYVKELNALKEEFKDKIEIYIGYESEYYPLLFEGTLSNIEKYGYDYLILGQHFTNNEYDGAHSSEPCDEAVFNQYINQVIEGMKTGKFSYVAHPDFINYRDDMTVFRKGAEKLCKASIQYDVPLEFNLLGFREKRWYPFSEFWKVAAETGAKAIIGCDAHSPQYVGKPDIYESAIKELKKFGITPIEKINFER